MTFERGGILIKSLLGITTIAIIGGGIWFTQTQKPISYITTAVDIRDVKEQVDVVGKVVAGQDVDLRFEVPGKVSAVLVDIGDSVTTGQRLVTLDTASLKTQQLSVQAKQAAARADIARAQAQLAQAQARLAELQAGTRVEEIDVQQATINQQTQALADAQVEKEQTLQKQTDVLNNIAADVPELLFDAYTAAYDAVYEELADFFIIYDKNTDFTPQLTFSVTTQLETDAERSRRRVETDLTLLQDIADQATTADDDTLFDLQEQALVYLLDVRSFLNQLDDVLNASTGLSSSQEADYRQAIYNARTNVNAEIQSLNNAQQTYNETIRSTSVLESQLDATINNAQSSLKASTEQLQLLQAGSRNEVIQAQEARVAEARASLSAAQAALAAEQASAAQVSVDIDKTTLVAPFSGTVTKQEADIGEIVTVSDDIIRIIASTTYEVEAFIAEVDIAKVTVGDMAFATLDAFGKDVLVPLEVQFIDPAQTVVNGVTTYRTVFIFMNDLPNILPGMNMDIVIDTRSEEGLAVPVRAIDFSETIPTVQVLVGENTVRVVPVTLGLQGSDGYVVVQEGVTTGDILILGQQE